uniref:Follistatin n=1 Tax=Schizaphis graminum TaxID=13262 RepID=A0A2S2NPV0_SCHGA
MRIQCGNNSSMCFYVSILESATCATVSCKSGQKCLVEKKTGRPRCVTCNLSCPDPETSGKRKDTNGKVCGSNDKTYHSWCQMFMDACATGVVIETKASGPCPEGETEVFNGNWNYVNASNVVIDGI